MPQPTAFDIAAPEYDRTFTETVVGKLQRQIVWDYLELNFHKKPLRILEINCGTGTDAAYLAKAGHKITATDDSEEMIRQAKMKYSGIKNLNFQVTAFDQLEDKFWDQKFDLIFSNFGGLNCISPEVLQHHLNQFKSLLNKNGRIVAVVMGNFCFLESLYFLFKLKGKEIFRRMSRKPVIADVAGEKVLTWYYKPATFFDMASLNFKKIAVKPVGTTIPPSFLNDFYEKRPALLSISKKVDKALAPLPFAANISDHYLIDIEVL